MPASAPALALSGARVYVLTATYWSLWTAASLVSSKPAACSRAALVDLLSPASMLDPQPTSGHLRHSRSVTASAVPRPCPWGSP